MRHPGVGCWCQTRKRQGVEDGGLCLGSGVRIHSNAVATAPNGEVPIVRVVAATRHGVTGALQLGLALPRVQCQTQNSREENNAMGQPKENLRRPRT